ERDPAATVAAAANAGAGAGAGIGSDCEEADVFTASDAYAARFRGSAGAWFLDRQAQSALALLADLPPGGLLLDVGGGHAQLAPALLHAGHRLLVLGSRPEAARRLTPFLADGRVSFETGSLCELPHESRSFDAVLCFRLLPHVSDPERLLGELCRVARRSVLFDYPSSRSFNRIARETFPVKRRIEGNTRPYRVFSPAAIERMLDAHGYQVREARPQFVLPMVFHRMHGSAAIGRLLERPGRAVGLLARFGSPVIVRADRRG
ncbi:MAG: methyltransferase domain-containing protein, partial [Candidatus Eisenbacteria bacterium]|nr:methyltransferase domain-containing protein [Candidatus Eisenbacteria bacterium]